MWSLLSRRWLTLVLAPLMLVTFAIACDDGGREVEPTVSPEATTTEATAAATPTAAPETLRLGVNIELTGQFSFIAEPYLAGLELAAGQINEAGGLPVGGKRYVIELVVRDAQLDPNVAVANHTELIRDEGLNFIFGPLSDIGFNPSYVIAKENGVWGMTFALTAQNTAVAESLSENPNLFIGISSTADSYTAAATAFRQFVPESEGNRVAVIGDDTPPSSITIEILKSAAVANGFEVVAEELFPAQGADFNTIMTTAKAANPDFIFAVATLDAPPLLKAAEELGVAKAYLTTPIDPQVPLEAAVGGPIANPLYIINTAPWFGELASSSERKAFGDTAAEAAGAPIPTIFQSVYDGGYYGLWMLAKAMEAAGTVDDVEAVSQALEGSVFDGPVGTAEIKGHFLTFPIEIAEIKDGQIAQICHYEDLQDITQVECSPPTP